MWWLKLLPVLRSKWLKWGVLVAVVVGGGYKAYSMYTAERQARIIAEFRLEGQKKLLEWTDGRLTQTDIDKAEMRNLILATQKVNGKLLATVGILVAQRDTTFGNADLPTTVTDSSRTASFADSAFGVTVKGMVSAPPFPAPLGIQYQFTRKAFHPTVGFAQVGDSIVALVNWEGEEFEIRSPSFRNPTAKTDRFGGFVEGGYAPFTTAAEARVGGRISAGHWSLQAVLEQDVPLHDNTRFESLDFYVGVRRDF